VSRYLDVLDGKRPGLAEKKSALAGDLQPGTILQARMIDVGKSLPVESPLLKQTERIDVACGEDSGRWFLTGRLVARDAEVAEQARKVVDGFLAIVRLQESSDREAVKLLERIQLAVKDRTLEIDFRIEADELVRRVEAIVERFLHRAKK
jgi:hypothetical protein